MNDLIGFLTSKEIIVVYIVFGIACLLCFFVYLLDKTYYKRRRKQNTRELNKLVEQVNDKMFEDKKDMVVKEEPLTSTIALEPEVLYVEDTIPNVVTTEEIEVVPNHVEVANVEVVEPITEVQKIEDVSPATDEEERIEDLILETMPEEDAVKKEETVVVNELEDNKNLIYVPIEPDKTEAQAELQKLTEELQKAEELTSNISLTSFEEKQEQEAIISLDELLKKSKEMYQSNEISQYEDEGNEPISIADLEKRYKGQSGTAVEVMNDVVESLEEPNILYIDNSEPKEIVQEKLILDDFNNIKVAEERPIETVKISSWSEEKKFKSSPVISPIFGIESSEVQTGIELENTANYEKLDEEIKKTNEFIMTLKELQKKLD